MKNLKKLREQMHMTQQDLAGRLGKTQQTVGRWETGKAEPSIQEMRDIAMMFGVSVDYLIGKPSAPAEACIPYLGEDQDGASGYWGNIGVKLPGAEKSRWYPVSEREATRISQFLSNYDHHEEGMLIVSTLNNRVLFMQPEEMERIALLDEACDEVTGDWDPKRDDIEGAPLELYYALTDHLDEMIGCPPEDSKSSDNAKMLVEIKLKEWDISTEDELRDFLEVTRINMTSGAEVKVEAKPSCLGDLHIYDLQDPPKMIPIYDKFSEMETFTPWKKIAMIDAPLISLIKDREQFLAEHAEIEDEK